MSSWTDFNDAPQQPSFDVIPKGTLAPVRMLLRPGGYDDPAQGWLGGYATYGRETGSVYLDCEFIVLQGPFAKRKVWSIIGLYSQKGPAWGQMGRSFIRAVLNSAYNISPQDMSPQATARRRIGGLGDLDGIAFLARIDVEKDANNDLRNVIKAAIEPDHPQYAALMAGGSHPAAPVAQTAAGYSAAPTAAHPPTPIPPASVARPAPPAPQPPASSNKPGWA